jgi:cellulose synthase/poly-beta-1,6-N-acetylglucosamine synthase-like glycosyltransferase
MIDPPKIVAVCASYNRPRLLGECVAMFLAQDYPNKELVILEDSGIFIGGMTPHSMLPEGVSLLLPHERMRCVGTKRNTIVKLTTAPLIAAWDDDDWYLPWHLSAIAAGLGRCRWVQPKMAMEWDVAGKLGLYRVYGARTTVLLRAGNPLNKREATDCCYGAQWGFRREAFLAAGGYPEGYGNGEDTALCGVMFSRFGPSTDSINKEFRPSYIYSRESSGTIHGSQCGRGLKYLGVMANRPRENPADFVIKLPERYQWAVDNVPDITQVQQRKW